MDYDTGQRVLFGRDGAPQAALPDAVVASCSIPGWYQPAKIGGRRYVDGWVRCLTIRCSRTCASSGDCGS